MTRSFSVTAAVLIAINFVPSLSAQTSTSISFNYAKIVYPGAIQTTVNGINNSNVVVGSYFDSGDVVHGFIYRQGKFSAVDVPGATATEVLGINDLGDIVGTYQLPGPLKIHSFVRHTGSFSSIDDPKATFATMAFGMSKTGKIVGSYDNAKGFVFENGAYRTLDAPQLQGEPFNTQLNGVNNLGWIAGQVHTRGIWRGFWIVNGDLDFLEAAGAKDSEVTGINGRGDIVGCHDAQSGFVSFTVENGEGSERAERFPQQTPLASCASAINYARVVVGNYFTVSRPYGFLAIPALTLTVTKPANHGTYSNPVRVSATALGNNSIVQIQVWVNSKQVFHVKGNTLNASVSLPIGVNERFVIQAVDCKGVTTKVVQTISVN